MRTPAGMAAQTEEIVVEAHLFHPQHLRPYPGERGLKRTDRPDTKARQAGHRRWAGQRPAIELAVGGERQQFQRHIGGGDHVLREASRKDASAARLDTDHFVDGCSTPTRRLPIARSVLANHRRRLLDPGARQQCRLDLTQLHPEAAQLDLIVVAAGEIERLPSGGIASQVAGLVEAIALTASGTSNSVPP